MPSLALLHNNVYINTSIDLNAIEAQFGLVEEFRSNSITVLMEGSW